MVRDVSTRSVDDLVEALGAGSGIFKPEVSRICSGLDEVVGAFRTRSLDQVVPYVYLDATYLNVRVAAAGQPGQVTSMAVVLATGIAADGAREILGLDVGDSPETRRTRCSGGGSSRAPREGEPLATPGPRSHVGRVHSPEDGQRIFRPPEDSLGGSDAGDRPFSPGAGG
jgi:hypothetical protein